MKKTILISFAASLLLLGGCASTPTEKMEQSFYAKEKDRIENTSSVVNVNKVTVQKIEFKDKKNLDSLFSEKEKGVAYMSNADYLERIKKSEVLSAQRSNLFIFEQDLYQKPSILKHTTVQSYIEAIQTRILKDDLTKTDYSIGTIEYGLEIMVKGEKNELTKKDTLRLHLKYSDLVEMKQIPLNEKDYIESPQLSIEDVETSLTFEKDANFIKKIGDNEVIVISLKKAAQENNKDTEK